MNGVIKIESNELKELLKQIQPYVRMHPWHGVPLQNEAGNIYTAYIEMVPADMVKYEVDKASGILYLDRPQKFASNIPSLYGFLPRTYCGDKIAAYCMAKTGLSGIVGDGDPLDICVLSEKPITHGDLLMDVIPIGGLRMIDDGEADDKIIAVLKGDAMMGQWTNLSDCPAAVIDRLRHYFLTYKNIPGDAKVKCQITGSYDQAEALEIIKLSAEDYADKFPNLLV